MKVPERYNYAEAYLSLRCPLECGYCINKFGEFTNREEISSDEWVTGLNKIDFGDLSITLGGGEPTKHEGFYDILNGLKPEISVDLLTNLQFDVDEFIERANPDRFTQEKDHYHPIRVSYHAEQMDRDKTLKDIKQLRDSGFNAAIFGVRHPYTINENMAMAFLCSQQRIPFYEKDFLGNVDERTYGFYKYPEGLKGIPQPMSCRTRELLIAPNGDIHRCHRDLYIGENPIGNITQDFTIEDRFRDCDYFGECNPCDLKLKTNKYLKGVECQVEIR